MSLAAADTCPRVPSQARARGCAVKRLGPGGAPGVGHAEAGLRLSGCRGTLSSLQTPVPGSVHLRCRSGHPGLCQVPCPHTQLQAAGLPWLGHPCAPSSRVPKQLPSPWPQTHPPFCSLKSRNRPSTGAKCLESTGVWVPGEATASLGFPESGPAALVQLGTSTGSEGGPLAQPGVGAGLRFCSGGLGLPCQHSDSQLAPGGPATKWCHGQQSLLGAP